MQSATEAAPAKIFRASHLRVMARKKYTLSFLGDIMLGRLIDQLLPNHVDEPEEARHVANIRRHQPDLRDYEAASPWGNTLPLLKQSDLILGNLETSATTCTEKWPDKVFNYRMHPANVESLKVAKIDYVSLANNHTLDFSRTGLLETIDVLQKAGIAYAGAGHDIAEAHKPAILRLPKTQGLASEDRQEHEIHLYSFSDHPSDWQKVPEFNLIRYTAADRARIEKILTQQYLENTPEPSLKVVSVHWGPNYAWEPDHDITSLAHFLIDECHVDIIHGHSSHHVQGIEIYKGKLILYGCGDFLDDYAVVSQYRNDLSAIWSVVVAESERGKLELQRLEVYPNRIKLFKAGLIPPSDKDHDFVQDHVRNLSAHFGTVVETELGSDGQLVIDLTQGTS